DTSLQVTVSIGIATGTSNSLPDFDTLLKRADMALYDAKANGRNRVCAAS
ncbi:MAG TPA: diguanylate cyclase, partial [Casimicrobium huifangae]|nr:diguanylate cyclase [Casimicrobium huifangae]